MIVELRWLPMTFALIVALGFFASVMFGKTRLLFAAEHDESFFKSIPKRISNVMIYAFGQKKMFKEPVAGVMHAFIFWGFLILQIRTIYLIALAFFPDAHLPFIHNGYSLAKDITEVVVLVMLSYALYRRLVIKPARLTASSEAVAILLLLAGLMLSDLLYDAFHFAHATLESGVTGVPIADRLASEMEWAPVGAALSNLFMGLAPESAIIGRELLYWSHIFIVLTLLNMLPGSKHFHIITAIPNVFFGPLTPKGALEPITDMESREEFGVGDVTAFTWKQMVDLYSCTECGRCQVNCPTTITGKPLNPKMLILDIRDHLYANEAEINAGDDTRDKSLIDAVGWDAIWDCTSCRACSEACPVQINHVDKIMDMRRHLTLMESHFPKELGATLKNLERKGNPWGLAAADRMAWAEGLDVPLLADKPDAEVVFWVGCSGAYDDLQKKVSRALVQILHEAKISFAVLGEEESCTGDPARRAGNEYLFQSMAEANIEILKAHGADKKKLVTHCPHCFNTLLNEYPQFGGQFEVIHHSTLIEGLIAEGKITPRTTPEGVQNVTYHDSCYIGRYNDIYEEPRNALKAIPGLNLKEMARNRTTGMCCGAGGSRIWLEEHNGTRINQTRVEQAMEVAPDTIAVACPFCHVMIRDGVNEKGIEGVKTRDIAQLVAESLGLNG